MRKLTLCLVVLFALCAMSVAGQGRPKYLSRIDKRAQFDLLSRITETPYPLPHVLFLIDRDHGDRVYYIDSKRSWHHREFANSEYLTLENNEQFLKNNYYNPNRRFILGWVAFYTPIDRWGFETWEGDNLTPKLISEASKALSKTFFTRLAFKPNSLAQEDASAHLQIERILPSELALSVPYQPLNLAASIGKLRIIGKIDQVTIVTPDDIVVVDSLPIGISPVAGLITCSPASALSHLNILARTWGIPSAYIKDATSSMKGYDGKWVRFEVKAGAYSIRGASDAEVKAARTERQTAHAVVLPKADLTRSDLAPLIDQRSSQVNVFGTKSANLGEVAHARIEGIEIPPGFTVPFRWYDEFLVRNGIKQKITVMLADPLMKSDVAYRLQSLKSLREAIVSGTFDPSLRRSVLEKVHKDFESKGLFVRSSTNAEDLPNFSGAGLYTTVPNVKGDDAIIEAIKTVWASVWNDDAFAAREQAGIDHSSVKMAVLLQEGINAESAGVMITTDPFDKEDADAVFISAKRGLGIKVVEGQKVPEQLIFHRSTNAIRVLTRSQEDSLLTFDPHGGVREMPTFKDRAVLTDELVRRLVKAAVAIKDAFHSGDQDIEWAFMKGTVYIVQARPYRD